MKRKKENKWIGVFTAVAGYLFAMALCVFFALYMSAPAGWTFFYVLAAAPVFSVLLTVFVWLRKNIELTASTDSTMVYKNEEFHFKINIRNKGLIPVPSVIIRMNECEGICCEDENKPYTVCVYTKGTAELSIGYKALMWGPAETGIKDVYISDFLGLIRLPVYAEKGEGKFISKVKVFPDIPDVPSDTPLIRSAAETIRFSDECEDTKETDGFGFFGGMPGYTHREYVQGDPIKRINWKLSSKKENYMVRLDDETESMQQVIVLDTKGGSRKENERAVEGVLAAAFSLFRLGFDTVVWYGTKHGFTPFEITEQGDIHALRTAFAEYSFDILKEMRIPLEELAEKDLSGIMLFTACPEAELEGCISEAKEMGIEITAVVCADESVINVPHWKMNADYTAEKI